MRGVNTLIVRLGSYTPAIICGYPGVCVRSTLAVSDFGSAAVVCDRILEFAGIPTGWFDYLVHRVISLICSLGDPEPEATSEMQLVVLAEDFDESRGRDLLEAVVETLSANRYWRVLSIKRGVVLCVVTTNQITLKDTRRIEGLVSKGIDVIIDNRTLGPADEETFLATCRERFCLLARQRGWEMSGLRSGMLAVLYAFVGFHASNVVVSKLTGMLLDGEFLKMGEYSEDVVLRAMAVFCGLLSLMLVYLIRSERAARRRRASAAETK